jgi:hypothetical protein
MQFKDLKVYDNELGFASLMPVTGFQGTTLFGSNGKGTSRLEVILPDDFSSREISVTMWFKMNHNTEMMSLAVRKV